MGIPGLLPALRDATKITTLAEYAGKRAGVDGFVWLHRACLTCARALARGETTTKYVSYFMSQVQLLTNRGIRPTIVFDGRDLPAKRDTNEKRRTARLESVRIAENMEQCGMKTEAEDYYLKSVDITAEMLVPIFQRLRLRNIDFIVAPYEADAQLAFLCLQNIVDFVITEDSDLLVYQCPETVFKLDSDGNCQSIKYSDVFGVREIAGLNPKTFRECCVLAGCDYLPSIPRMGFRTAVKRMLRYRTAAAVIAGLRSEGTWEVPSDYEARFNEACAIFVQQRVYDPRIKRTVGIHEECKLDVAGPILPVDMAVGIATGKINPRTLMPLEEKEEDEPEEKAISCTPPSYSIPVSPSANQPFKPHRVESWPLRSLHDPIKKQLRVPGGPPKRFIPPSLRNGTMFLCQE